MCVEDEKHELLHLRRWYAFPIVPMNSPRNFLENMIIEDYISIFLSFILIDIVGFIEILFLLMGAYRLYTIYFII